MPSRLRHRKASTTGLGYAESGLTNNRAHAARGNLKEVRMRKIITIALVFASSLALAHSGGTDSNGCHVNHKTGVYHCH